VHIRESGNLLRFANGCQRPFHGKILSGSHIAFAIRPLNGPPLERDDFLRAVITLYVIAGA
jgi:hypothetical protein